jgi:hypothetical protein
VGMWDGTLCTGRLWSCGMVHCVQGDLTYPDVHSECWNILNNALHSITSKKHSQLQ